MQEERRLEREVVVISLTHWTDSNSDFKGNKKVSGMRGNEYCHGLILPSLFSVNHNWVQEVLVLEDDVDDWIVFQSTE